MVPILPNSTRLKAAPWRSEEPSSAWSTEEARADNLACLPCTRGAAVWGRLLLWFVRGVGESCCSPVAHLATTPSLATKNKLLRLLANLFPAGSLLMLNQVRQP
jgi:hypothetical protein